MATTPISSLLRVAAGVRLARVSTSPDPMLGWGLVHGKQVLRPEVAAGGSVGKSIDSAGIAQRSEGSWPTVHRSKWTPMPVLFLFSPAWVALWGRLLHNPWEAGSDPRQSLHGKSSSSSSICYSSFRVPVAPSVRANSPTSYAQVPVYKERSGRSAHCLGPVRGGNDRFREVHSVQSNPHKVNLCLLSPVDGEV